MKIIAHALVFFVSFSMLGFPMESYAGTADSYGVSTSQVNTSTILNSSTQSYLDTINENDAIRGLVFAAMASGEYEGLASVLDGPDSIPEAIELDALNAYLADDSKPFFNLGLVGGWEFEYYSSELTLAAFDIEYHQALFDNTKKYSVRNIDDWSWMELFTDKNISLHFRSFTETDFSHLHNTGFYEKLEGHVYGILSSNFSRVMSLNLEEAWPLSLLREDRTDSSNAINAFSFGGRFPVTVTETSFEELVINPDEHTYIDPSGTERPFSTIGMWGPVDSIVFLDDGTYVYFSPYYMNLVPTGRSESAYYNKTTEGKIIARYDKDYDIDSSQPYYKLNDNIPVSYDDSTGEVATTPSGITYSELKQYKEFRFGGSRNLYTPLMFSLEYGDFSDIWMMSSSHWNAYFQFPSNVTVNYEDTQGNKLITPSAIIEGKVDQPYTTTKEAISGYSHVKTIGTPAGVFQVDDTVVTYVYSKNTGGGSGGSGGGGGNESTPGSIETHAAYVDGYSDGTFRPEGSITRAEVATIFSRLLTHRGDTTNGSKSFTDVDPTSWYGQYVKHLSNYNIISGYPDGSFRPDMPISRAELSSIISKFDEAQEAAGKPKLFSDVSLDHWAKKYIDLISAKGIVQGYPSGEFKPDSSITRSETVTMVNPLLKRKADSKFLEANKDRLKTYSDLKSIHWAYEDIQEASNLHICEEKDSNETWTEIQR